MKNAKEISLHLNESLDSMLKRPQMWASTPEWFEHDFIDKMELLAFINEKYEADKRNPVDAEWRKFAHKEIDYKHANPVSYFLISNNGLDDDWRSLTDLLAKFRNAVNK